MNKVYGLSAIVLSASTSLASSVLYDQMTGVQALSWWGSNVNADPVRNVRSFDNFTLSAPGVVDTVDWSGMLDAGLGSDGFQSQPVSSITGFQITFYQHDTGTNLPGAILADQLIAPVSITENNFGQSDSWYRAALNSPVALDAGVQYWFSVAAVLPSPDGSVLLWRGGAWEGVVPPGDGYGAWDNNAGANGSRSVDSIFRLSGVPSPSALSVLGISGLLTARRRRSA